MKILFCIILLKLLLISDGANILFYIPTASFSHQFPFRSILRELSHRGHNLTILTTDPMKDANLRNVKEIDLRFTYDIYEKYNFVDLFDDVTKGVDEKLKIFRMAMSEAFAAQMESSEVKSIIEGDQKFDLVIIEAQLPHQLGLAWKLKCPFIGVTSLDAPINYHLTFGNPTHPVINPDSNLPILTNNMSFWNRLISTLYRLFYEYRVMYNYYPMTTLEVRKYFGDDMPQLLDIQRNMSMLFINTHPIFHNIRALNPNTITIGTGLHINAPKPLPKDLENFLDNAKEGVIYFSLGTNVGPKSVNETLRAEILNAFRELPYKVLMKFKAELKDVPKNVNVQKWVPQQDILRHPNVRLFITQGGLQSLQEAVYNQKPVVAIPFFGDQLSNVEIAVSKGYGVKIAKQDLNKHSLLSAIKKVLNNKKYFEKARELGELFRDEPESSVDKAVWWTEYVIRHKGAQHLKNPGADLPWWKYLLLDVVIFVSSILLSIICVLYLIIKLTFSCLFTRNKKVKVQ